MALTVILTNRVRQTAEGQYGTYTFETLEYEYQGSKRSMRIYPQHLKKYPNLKADLAKVVIGSSVDMELVPTIGKDGKEYGELTSINPSLSEGKTQSASHHDTKPSHSTKPYNPDTTTDRDIGMQVGNAITNAVSSLGAGVTLQHIEERIWDLILIGERTKMRLKNKEHLKLEKSKFTEELHNQDQYPDTDIPY